MRQLIGLVLASIVLIGLTGNSDAATLTFDDSLSGQTSYSFDGDGDGSSDVVLSTTDPSGFNTVGPGPNMSYIAEPGLEGTSLLEPDLRVDFLVGAQGSLSFGFALLSFSEGPGTFASFSVFDALGNLLASATVPGLYTTPDGENPSSFPEGIVNVTFAGTGAYGLFDFNSDAGRYIIDNFEGQFGTSEVPEPSTATLLVLGLLALSGTPRSPR